MMNESAKIFTMRCKCLIFLWLVMLLPLEVNIALAKDLKSNKENIRIAILKDVEHVYLKTKGQFVIIDPEHSKDILKGRVLPTTKIFVADDMLQVGSKITSSKRIRIISNKDIIVKIRRRNRRYRGEIDVIVDESGKLIVINRIGLEDYIRGVLYHEVSHKWPMEAMKAQAVAARTYAIYRMKERAILEFDVTSDIYSQVYGGRSSEKYRTNLAVKRTRDEVLIYDKKILPAYYHANCGGHTEDVTNLWKHEKLLPLDGKVCGFCSNAPHYVWKKNLRLKFIQDKLNSKGHSFGLIKDLSIIGSNKSGRIKNIKITERNGKETVILGKDFRNKVGPNIIKSNRYSITMKGYYCDLSGKGWGHGVGMCQWGASQMSHERFKYDEILLYYYPEAKIVEFSDVKNELKGIEE